MSHAAGCSRREEVKINDTCVRHALIAIVVLVVSTSVALADEITVGTQLDQWENYPLSTANQTARSQAIYLANEIESSGLISSIALDVVDPPWQVLDIFTIRMKHTSLSSYDSPILESTGWTTVYQASEYIASSGWRTFNFPVPFLYNGQGNLMVDFSFSNSWGSLDGYCACSAVDKSRTLTAADVGTFGDPLTWSQTNSPAVSAVNEIPNIKLVIDPETSVITPQFSLQEGIYSTSQDIVVTCLTKDAVIHYTTNGLTPTHSDPVVASGGSVRIGHTLTFKARAWKEGMDPSGVRSTQYIIPTAAVPVFSIPAAVYHTPQNVVVTCATPGAAIHYTTNGNEPTETDPVITSGSSINIDHSLTLKASAWMPGVDPSTVNSAVYTFEVNTPTFSPDGGTYSSAQDIIVTCSNTDAVIHYTTNGAVPTRDDPVVASGSPIHLDSSTPLKAVAFKTGWNPSPTKYAVYVISGVPIIFYVTPNGNDNNDGLTWAKAKKTLQGAINSATSGQDIWFAAGTYIGGITMRNGISLYGGFAGTETDRAQRNINLNKTIINGSNNGAVVNAVNLLSNTVIDGFTIQKGQYLGGIYCNGGSPVISNNILTLNCNPNGWGSYTGSTMCGGGINLLNSNATVKDNIITENSASYQGGGIYVIGGSPVITKNSVTKNSVGGVYAERSSAAITGNIISDNTAGYHGGGLSVFWCNSTVSGNTIENNKSLHVAGGIDLAFGGNVNVTENVIRGNSAANCGGIWLDGNNYGMITGTLQATISNNIIDNNYTTTTSSYFSGGGIASTGPVSQLTIQGNQITNDISTGYGGGGISVDASSVILTIAGNTISACRAVRNGGGIFAGAAATISNNIITNNAVISSSSTSYGGGIYSYGSANIYGNKLIGNTALAVSDNASYGGGIYMYRGKALNNTIIANGAMYGGGLYGTFTKAVVNNSIVANTGAGLMTTSATTVTNNLIAYNSIGSPTNAIYSNNNSYGNKFTNYPNGILGTSGNISADPKLADLENGNIHLMPGSPCIDAGLYTTLLDGITDVDSQARVMGSAVDIGADESDGTIWQPGPYCVIKVSTLGSDANDGLTWATAKKTIQAAVDSAALLGGEVWVTAGSYAQPVMMKPFVYLYGGFAGSETSRDQRNWNSNVTVIDGNSKGSAITYAFGGEVSLVDGFTVTHGKGTQCANGYYGGGIYCLYADMTVKNCSIISNNTTNGGGIYTKFGCPNIIDNLIASNYADSGSAILSDVPLPGTTGGGNLICNTISDNVGLASSNVNYSAVRLLWQSGTVANNIITYNTSGPYISNPAIAKNNDCYKNGYDSSIVTGLNNNISVNPVFVSKTFGDYRLSPVSACIDAGDSSVASSFSKDLAGSPRIFGGGVDIGAYECSGEAASILDAKLYHPNLSVNISSAIITAAFPDYFYIESENRACGIRVQKAGHGLSAGVKVSVTGTLATLDTKESAILATSVHQLPGAGVISPLGMANRKLGGGPFGYQAGLSNQIGLNNVGILVSIWGTVTLAGRGWFYLDDGSRVSDGSGVKGIYVDAAGLKAPSKGSMVRVTGISSCDVYNDSIVNTLLVSSQSDIQTVPVINK